MNGYGEQRYNGGSRGISEAPPPPCENQNQIKRDTTFVEALQAELNGMEMMLVEIGHELHMQADRLFGKDEPSEVAANNGRPEGGSVITQIGEQITRMKAAINNAHAAVRRLRKVG